jgi:glycosyl transferase family 87
MTARTSRSTAVHRALALLLALLCAWFAIRGWSKAQRPDSGSDFPIYFEAGRAFLAGEDPSGVEDFLYLPAFAAFAAPFALLPYALAAALWQLLSLGAVLWSARRCAQLATPLGAPVAPWLMWAPLACVLRLVDSNLSYAQVNAFTFVLALEACASLRGGRARAAGVWAGAATMFKLLPAFVVAQFALRRQWRATLWALAAAAVLIFVPAWLALGWSGTLRAHASWWHKVAAPYQIGGRALLESRAYLPGQSLTASGYRLLTATPARSPAKLDASGGGDASLLELDPDLAHWILLAVAAAHAAVWAATVWLRPSPAGSRGFAVESALTLALALLLGPLVHKAHMLWLMLAYAACLGGALRELGPAARVASWALVGTSLGLIAGTTPLLVGRSMATGLLSHNAIFFGLECLFGALLLARWSSPGGFRSGDAAAAS